MKITKNDAFPSLVDLNIEFCNQEDEGKNCFALIVDLRIGKEELDIGDHEFEISIDRLFLQLDLSGYDIKMGSRFGEPVMSAPKISRTDKEIVMSTVGGGAVANASSAGQASANVMAGAAAGKAKITQDEISEVRQHIPVKARGNKVWEVTHSENREELDGTYLHAERLCILTQSANSNRNEVNVQAIIKKSDIQFNSKSSSVLWRYNSANRKKVIEAVVAKQLSGDALFDLPEGKIRISLSVVEEEFEIL